MKKTKKRCTLYVITLNIITLSFNIAFSKNISSNQLYMTIQNQLYHSNYKNAIENLIKLNNLYLPDPYPQQIHINLIYAYYKSYNFKEASDYIQSFLKLYPHYKHIDYILYMNGIVNMSLDKFRLPIKFFNINWLNRDLTYTYLAFYSLSQIIIKYPNSQYFEDSRKRLIYLKNKMANHELSIIKFYDKKKAYIPIITRTEKMLYNFPDTQATFKALSYMKKAYQKINLLEKAQKIEKIISYNSQH